MFARSLLAAAVLNAGFGVAAEKSGKLRRFEFITDDEPFIVHDREFFSSYKNPDPDAASEVELLRKMA